jgi:hypothetical protein
MKKSALTIFLYLATFLTIPTVVLGAEGAVDGLRQDKDEFLGADSVEEDTASDVLAGSPSALES